MPNANKKHLISSDTLIKLKVLLFCVVSLISIQVDHRTSYLLSTKYYMGAIAYPLKKIAELPEIVGRGFKVWFAQKSDLINTVQQLQSRQLTLEFEVQKIATLVAENKRLRMLLKSSNEFKAPTLVAEIISVESNPYRHIISLNRGSNDSINKNQPIIDTLGIIGQTIDITPFSSQAMLITDPQHLLPVQINRNGIRGLAIGTGNFKQLKITNIPINEDVKVGDLLISSGLDGRFPQGYPVAKIERIEHDPTSYFAKIIAVPTAQLDKVREVLIILEPEATLPQNEVAP